MYNVSLKLAYDGTQYLGWQKTKMGPSIEETLEKVLLQVLQHTIKLQAASRTDAGVHASGQIVNFYTPKALALDQLHYSLNCLLPKDIVVIEIKKNRDHFHPTLDCKSKEYHYHVCYGNVQLPHQRHFFWHYPYSLDIPAINQAMPILTGEHDFSAFCNTKKNGSYVHYIRNLESIKLYKLADECLRFEVRGNNFLYKMVRNVIGTLIYIGCGKINCSELLQILQGGDRKKAGMTAPALGLCLHKVIYQ